MDAARPSNPNNLYSLQQAAEYLAVKIDVLLKWNEHNILKPIITPTGDIAYSKDQLDNFKNIQSNANSIPGANEGLTQAPIYSSNSPAPHQPQSSPVVKTYHQKQQNNYSQINNYNFYSGQLPTSNQNHSNKPREVKAAFSIFGVFVTLSFFGFVVLFVFFSQQSKVNSILNQTDNKEIAYDSTNSTIRTLDEKESQRVPKNTLSNNGSEKNKDLNAAFDDKKPTNIKQNDNEKEIIESVLGEENQDKSNLITKTDYGIVTYGQKANYRETSYPEYSNEDDVVSEVFDTEGNIKVSGEDPSESDLLATALGVKGFSQTQDIVRRNSGSTGLITFVILGLIFFYFIYSTRRQLIPSHTANTYNDLAMQPVGYNAPSEMEWEKLIEINQKTDGTVVINFQGNEYRISKPELDSESDKFIERLMQLTKNGEKEIEYDILSDLELSTNTPLSKIVTRLGFVGLKRDLFFPRTSKSRVVFRKYLTLDDLFSMNLTIEDLSDRIKHVN